jgi:polar amino acid transport system substrate-binding protein
MRRRIGHLLVLVCAAVTIAGCGAGADQAARLTLAALATKAPQSSSSASQPAPASSRCNLKASLRPPATLPAPGAMPAGSFMATIEHRGYLIAGVNAGFYGFGYLNPSTGSIQGFEIDLVHALAHAIFGNKPNDVQLRALTATQRFRAVQQSSVDIVVDAVTITCARRQLVDFSTVYYDTGQKVLVPTSSEARGLQALGGKRVCATAGTTPIQVIQQHQPHPNPYGAPQAIDCLRLLQEGRVDAISTDNSILLGFTAQDPYTKIVGPPLADVPYGMAISKAHPEFVRFVNGVLAQMRADGTWRALYAKWLGRFGAKTPNPPSAQYEG